MFTTALKEALLTGAILFSPAILYVLFCLGRGVVEDVKKWIG
jgi:hypothetical protein